MSASNTISTRIGNKLYTELCDFSLENKVHLSTLLKTALLQWMETKKLPTKLLNSAKVEKANDVLKQKMREVLFMHNLQRKLKRLFTKEKLHKTQIPLVVVPLIEAYKEVAEANEWTEKVGLLDNLLIKYNSTNIIKQAEFMKWLGLNSLGEPIIETRRD